MEVYVDDRLVKSPNIQKHIHDLAYTFSTLREYDMKLNPNKRTFVVETKKKLGFMVSEKGIETNPKKNKQIWRYTPSQKKLVKDV